MSIPGPAAGITPRPPATPITSTMPGVPLPTDPYAGVKVLFAGLSPALPPLMTYPDTGGTMGIVLPRVRPEEFSAIVLGILQARFPQAASTPAPTFATTGAVTAPLMTATTSAMTTGTTGIPVTIATTATAATTATTATTATAISARRKKKGETPDVTLPPKRRIIVSSGSSVQPPSAGGSTSRLQVLRRKAQAAGDRDLVRISASEAPLSKEKLIEALKSITKLGLRKVLVHFANTAPPAADGRSSEETEMTDRAETKIWLPRPDVHEAFVRMGLGQGARFTKKRQTGSVGTVVGLVPSKVFVDAMKDLMKTPGWSLVDGASAEEARRSRNVVPLLVELARALGTLRAADDGEASDASDAGEAGEASEASEVAEVTQDSASVDSDKT